MAGFWYRATISFQTEVSAWDLPGVELGLILFIIQIYPLPPPFIHRQRNQRD
jgi:hypothetical protein